jgi:hypothetical protein
MEIDSGVEGRKNPQLKINSSVNATSNIEVDLSFTFVSLWQALAGEGPQFVIFTLRGEVTRRTTQQTKKECRCWDGGKQ